MRVTLFDVGAFQRSRCTVPFFDQTVFFLQLARMLWAIFQKTGRSESRKGSQHAKMDEPAYVSFDGDATARLHACCVALEFLDVCRYLRF